MPNASGPGETENRIIVTGSRIARPDYQATSPIVTVDADLIEQSSAVSLEANLNKLPQFSPALTQFDTAEIQPNANTTPGASTISLRQLGANRNLVLLDGRRPTPINGTGVVDINTIPSAAIQRVEIITGGASSTYGADAVGGVVNFILKDDFTGVNFDGQVSFSPESGGEEYRVSSLLGSSLDDGRGSVILGMEYYKREALLRQDRKAYRNARRDPFVRGEEFFLSENYVSTAGSNPFGQGAINAAFPERPAGVNIPRNSGIYFNDDGSLWVNTSTTANGTYYPLLLNYQGGLDDGLTRKIVDNGLLEQNNPDRLLSSPQSRYSFFAKGDYEMDDWISFIGQAYFARTETKSVSFNTVLLGSTGTEIPYDDEVYTGSPWVNDAADFKWSSVLPDGTPGDLSNNPTNPDFMAGGRFGLNCGPIGGCTNREVFPVPANIAALLNSRADPDAPWIANYSLDAFGRRGTENFVNTFQIQLGFEGDVPGTDFTWDVIASHGETVAKTNLTGLVSLERFRTVLTSPNYGSNFFALGNNGQRYGATASCDTGLSPFIVNSAFSEDCDLATSADAQFENRIAQDLIEANLQGGLFELPGGELRFAIGAAYRKNSINFTSDSSAFEGSSFYETITTFPQASSQGSTAVQEAYGELLIPVLSDLPFARVLNLELGYRLSDYDSVGTIGTYKINGEWAPTYWLRFRGGYQSASRAPNLGELFTARTNSLLFAGDGDPCSLENDTSPLIYGNYSANPELNPEYADEVQSLCRQLMGADGAADYYRTGRDDFLLDGQFFTGLLAGASELQEETAKTYTIGAVLSDFSAHPWLTRFRLSVDYYNIKLSDGISQQGIDSVFRQCFTPEFNPSFELNAACRRIERDQVDGTQQVVVVNYDNLGAVETAGIDVQLDWGLNFRDAGIGIPGTLAINANLNWLDRFATTPDQVTIPLTDYVGTLGPTGANAVGTQSGSYRWKLFTRINYTLGPATIGLQWQHKPAIDSVSAATDETNNVAGAPAYDLFNLTGRYQIMETVSFRFGIDNLLDQDPPYLGYFVDDVVGDGTPRFGRAANPYDPSQYDVLGRRFYVGATVSF
ncbi:TonB-dependent receptor domain-containing protein [Altericroceibacterium xinjiangense]|uniref:TonB-dependent receptor domain-containing protein n=1 Tax=Altericroceibacterium xinjiangense TaxID=762261 RepID=UPI001F4A055B|nr:TonB-dependent receptor [Altericroceibacterium xinjiangense]